MLDRWTGAMVRPPLRAVATQLTNRGISANQVTVGGFLLGMLAVPLLASGQYLPAMLMIGLNRVADGLDGALARLQGTTDVGGFLDITLDFIFYAAVICGFALAEPQQNALAACVLLMSFMGTGSSFLAFASIAAKRGIDNPVYQHKSLYYLGGLTEGTETIMVFLLMCLLPGYFPLLAYSFAALCMLTTLTRVLAGVHSFRQATAES